MNHDEMPPKPIYVYVLTDPRKPDDVRYVGVTSIPKRRLYGHIKESKNETHRRARWINSLVRDGLKPIMTLIDETNSEEWQQCEIGWIAYYRGLGCDLVNSTDGGDGVMNPSDETRYKRAEKARGKHPSDETRRKLSEAKLGKVHSEESKRRRSESWRGEKNPNYGKSPSDETRRKISEAIPSRKPIIQYTKNGTFVRNWDSASQAGRVLGIPQGHIGKCCQRKKSYYTAGGYIWRYADDPLPSNELTQLSFNFDE